MVPGGVEQRPRRSQEVKGSLELQNGVLRALEEAWMMTFCLTHSVKSCRLLCFRGEEEEQEEKEEEKEEEEEEKEEEGGRKR